MTDNRKPRDLETRDAEMNEAPWVQPEHIPPVLPRDGYGFRWIRVSTLGETDTMNMDRAFREGWVPATETEVPELAHLSAKDGRGRDILVNGGLVLCKMTMSKIRQRDQFYERRNAAAQLSVDEQLRQNASEDKRMPLFNESRREIKNHG